MKTQAQKTARRLAKLKVTLGERCFYSLVSAAVIASYVVGFVASDSRDGWIHLSWLLAVLAIVAFGALVLVRNDPVLDGSTTDSPP